jgi:AraC family transcriptional regulator of adaptative response/methylated-DNA-[protein]-cysteine methyltransferase
MKMKDGEGYHYRVMARALAVLDAEGPGLTLEDLAARMGMSAAHFQRLFSAWVGVSPKRYQQYLALDQARRMLAARTPVPDAALAAGLSGPGRLHDAMVTWEAMTPGQFARGGAGLTIRWAVAASPFGPVVAMATDRGLCGLAFAAETGVEAAAADLRARWRPWVRRRSGGGAVRLHAIGAPFQIKVWEALLRIPSGTVATYSEVAAAAGVPQAVRAAGTAIGRNPVSYLIPCHRVLRNSGALGGYHWGLPVKRTLLAWEAARAEAGVAQA